MEPRPELLAFYLELIDAYEDQGQVVLRDYFTLLAADAYLASGQEEEAEALFSEFAGRNPEHVLTRNGNLTTAVHHPEGSEYLVHLRQNYPEDVVRDLVQEARNRRPVPPLRGPSMPFQPAPAAQPMPVPLPPARQSNPPNRGPGNPVPAPRPAPTMPPRRDPAPVPVRPQPVPARPAPTTPSPQKHQAAPPPTAMPGAGPQPEPESPGVPIVNFMLFLLLIALGVFLAGWSLVLPLLGR